VFQMCEMIGFVLKGFHTFPRQGGRCYWATDVRQAGRGVVEGRGHTPAA
jgi:hypothetical protein